MLNRQKTNLRIRRIGLNRQITRAAAIFAAVFLASLAVAAAAAAPSAPITTLEEATSHALLHNAGVKAAFDRWQAAVQRSPQARALPDPKLTYSYYIENVETRVGPQEQALGVAQTLPWFGKRDLRAEAADAGTRAARQRYEQAKLDLLYDVKSAYYELYYIRRAIGITRDNMKLLETLEKVAQSRYKTGGPMVPLVQLQTELGKLEDRIHELEALRPAREAQLNAALNRPPDAPVSWPDNLTVPDVELNDNRLRDALAANSPLLRRYDAQVDKHAVQARLAAKRRRPDFTVGLKTLDTGDARNPGTPGSGTDPVMATVSVNLPIWRSSYDAAEEEAERNRWATIHEKAETRNQQNARLEMALFQYRDAGRKIDLYKNTLVPKAEQSLKVARQAFEVGEAEFLALIDAERMLLEFELQHERARTERARQLALIEKLIGVPVESISRPATKPQPPGEQTP